MALATFVWWLAKNQGSPGPALDEQTVMIMPLRVLDEEDGAEFVAHLRRNGIDATHDTIETAGGEETGAATLDYVKTKDANLLIKGAYTHTRLRQIVFGGATASQDFPITPGAFRESYIGGSEDGFVAEMDIRKSGGEQLIYSTYFGGTNADIVTDLALNQQGHVVLGGSTRSVSRMAVLRLFIRG